MKPIPTFLYGTAWKEHRTADLTYAAIAAGFRAIDTANQRKHYFEEGVGDGIARAVESGLITRDDLFIQTKFTYMRGQDHRLPYDPKADLADQVEQSFASSLQHLRVSKIDSLVLHGPATGGGLTDADWKVWSAMEGLRTTSRVDYLGVSNVSLGQLKLLLSGSKIRPTFVQNRCYAELGWDLEIRRFCKEHNIIYQGFSLLTANQSFIGTPRIAGLAKKYQVTTAQLIFRFVQQVGMLPLTGTASELHMSEDLACDQIQIDRSDLELIEKVQIG